MPEFRNSNGEIRLNLEQQKKRAKELLRQFKACQVSAFKRFEQHHPQGKNLDTDIRTFEPKLSDAQLVIARENGLSSWAKLKAHIEKEPLPYLGNTMYWLLATVRNFPHPPFDIVEADTTHLPWSRRILQLNDTGLADEAKHPHRGMLWFQEANQNQGNSHFIRSAIVSLWVICPLSTNYRT